MGGNKWILSRIEDSRMKILKTWRTKVHAQSQPPPLSAKMYSVSGLSCPEAEAYLTVIFHSFLHNNNMKSDYILGAIIYFTPQSNFSSYF